MPNIVYPNSFSAGSLARASEVNANFDAVTDVVNGNITETNLAANAVATAKLQDAAVTNSKLNTGIDASKLADGTVSNTEFQYLNGVTSAIQSQLDAKLSSAAGAVATANLANDAVTADKIATDAVTTDAIANLSITDPKIGVGAVTSTRIAADAVINTKIADNAVTTSKIFNDAVTTEKINAAAVTRTKLSVKYYGGTVLFDATGTLPAGWSVTRPNTGRYLITHNLGTTSYAFVAIPGNGMYLTVYTTAKGANSIEVVSTLNFQFDFVVVMYDVSE